MSTLPLDAWVSAPEIDRAARALWEWMVSYSDEHRSYERAKDTYREMAEHMLQQLWEQRA